MTQRLPPPERENFTLGLAGYGFLNPEPSQAVRTVLPVSRQLSFPPTELEIALAEREGGVIATATHVHPTEPSCPKKAQK